MLKKITLTIIGLISLVALALFALVWLSPPRPQLAFDDPYGQERQTVQASEYAVATGTPWATKAAVDVLESDGNAVDAAVAAVLMLNVTFGEAASFPGVAPVMLYDAKTKTVRSYIGAGTAPKKATLDLFKERGHEVVPNFDILAQLLPASPDVLIRLLQEYGSKSFSQLVQPAIDKARDGFPVHHTMAKNLNLSFFKRMGYTYLLPTNSAVYFGKQWWLPLGENDLFRRPLLANTLEALAQAEQEALAKGANRKEALKAVRDYFYEGPIAEQISAYHEQENGLITAEDLATYKGAWEVPLEGHYNEYTIYVNSTWTQGIVIPMVLQLLEGIDLKAMGHNSADYVHTLSQAIDLSMADREAYVTDPAFGKVSNALLLSKAFAAERRKAMTEKAFSQMPEPGKVEGLAKTSSSTPIPKTTTQKPKKNMLQAGDDTSQVVVVDKEGNAIAITPSDFPMSPMIPNTGLTLGIRMTQFNLDPNHVNHLEPGKRPRITPHAAIVFKNGAFFMAFNTPGGDMQTQALVQVFLNIVVFGMDVQTAINAPRLRSYNFPNSFNPKDYAAGLLRLEQGLYEEVAERLKARNYRIEAHPDLDNEFSAVGAIVKDSTGLFAGVDPRESGVAAGK